MADAEAICEAVARANMRFVPTKTPEQQSCLMLHRTRHLFIRQQTAVINSIRAHLAEFGIVAPVGRKGVTDLLHIVADPSDKRVPEVARVCLAALVNETWILHRRASAPKSVRRPPQYPPLFTWSPRALAYRSFQSHFSKFTLRGWDTFVFAVTDPAHRSALPIAATISRRRSATLSHW